MVTPPPDWNLRFSEPGFAYGTVPNDFLVEVTSRLPPGPVLSLGEGEGRNGVYLAGTGREVFAVDGSPVGLAKAQALASERGLTIHTEVADLATYAIEPGRWPVILCFFVHMPKAVRARIFETAARGLQPGGMFVLEAFRPGQIAHGTGGPQDPERLATLAQIQSELPGLEWVIVREIERVLDEGRYHSGPSATVQLLARRPV
jgi:SAM-dependent methyltransferase